MLRLESDDTNPDDDLDELETETKDRDFQVLKKNTNKKRDKNWGSYTLSQRFLSQLVLALNVLQNNFYVKVVGWWPATIS